MNPEKALATYYVGPYMRSAKAQVLIDAEVGKGCDGKIFANPVALEPVFNPITVPKDIMVLKDRLCVVYESPPSEQRHGQSIAERQHGGGRSRGREVQVVRLLSHASLETAG